MPDLVEELAAQGRSLPPAGGDGSEACSGDLLLESLQRTPQEANGEAWNNEIARRVAAHERGEGKLHDMEEVLAEASRLAP